VEKLLWLKRRWLEIRSGNLYITFVLSSFNFIMIAYGLKFLPSFLQELPVYVFGLVVLLVIVPITVGLGRFHLYNQYHVDAEILTEQHPYYFKMVKNSKELVLAKAQLDTLIALKHILNKNFTRQLEDDINDDIEKLKLLINGMDSRTMK